MTTLSFDNVVKYSAPSVSAGQFIGGELFMSHRKFGFPDRQHRWRLVAMTAIGLVVALVGAACSGAGGGGGSSKTLTVAAVDNPQMADLKKLLPDFHSAHSDIDVKIVTLPEDQLRQQVTQDVAANSGRFDLFTIGTY